MSVDPNQSHTGQFRRLPVPGLDLAELDPEDRLVFENDCNLYQARLLQRNLENQPPLWWVELHGSGRLYPEPRELYLVGADPYFQTRGVGEERDPRSFVLDQIVQGLPLAVGEFNDVVLLAPTRKVWVNGDRVL